MGLYDAQVATKKFYQEALTHDAHQVRCVTELVGLNYVENTRRWHCCTCGSKTTRCPRRSCVSLRPIWGKTSGGAYLRHRCHRRRLRRHRAPWRRQGDQRNHQQESQAKLAVCRRLYFHRGTQNFKAKPRQANTGNTKSSRPTNSPRKHNSPSRSSPPPSPLSSTTTPP